VLAGFIDAGGVSSWKYAERKLTVAGSLSLWFLRYLRDFLLADSSLIKTKSASGGSAIEGSGARGGVTMVVLVDNGMDRLNEQQKPKSTLGSFMLFNADAMDLRAESEESSFGKLLLLVTTNCVRPKTQKLQTLKLQFWQCTY
jgi:hypothetical protein